MRASCRRSERAKAAGATAAELMSTPPVTISPDASAADAAKPMYDRGVKRLPVVDSAGQLAGIVSRIDVLSVHQARWPDPRRRDAKGHRWEFALDPAAFEVTVTSGMVTVTGQVERRAIAGQLIDAVQHLEGVVDVRDRVSCPYKDR